ncbi:MAG: glycosyltransferase family 4 protein [Actinomycetota bacterium]
MSGRLAFVAPRYGLDVLGGAETVVRQLAERLVGSGLEVEVLVSCAKDHYTWANHYPPGEERVNGVLVRRFPVVRTTSGRRHKEIGDRIGAGFPTTLAEQEEWINDGMRVPGVFHWLMDEADRYDSIILTPYMFWTTYACAQVAPSKNVLRPCLHDEPYARLEIYRDIFESARGITFNSPPERDLADSLYRLPASTAVVGEGVDLPPEHDASRFRAKYGVEGDFLIYAGRREWGKNVDVLAEHFARYRRLHAPDLKLVLLGKGDVRMPEDPQGIVDLGFLPEQDKHDAFAAACVVCQPSRWESFSRLIMDGWIAATPSLVWDGCAVTVYHALTSGGGLIYNDYYEFEQALDFLLAHPDARREMGERGRAYVLENYQWEQVVDRLLACLETWRQGKPTPEWVLAQGSRSEPAGGQVSSAARAVETTRIREARSDPDLEPESREVSQ